MIRGATILCVAILSMFACASASAQVEFTGTVVDLAGAARAGVNVTPQITAQDSNVDLLDRNDPAILAGTLAYDPTTARFFLPIREDLLPAGDVTVRIRFSLEGQVFGDVQFLSGLVSQDLTVVVPGPEPKACKCKQRCRRFFRGRRR